MNRLWIRLSLSYAAVLLVVLSMPTILFWFAFMHRGRHNPILDTPPPEARVAVATFFYLLLVTAFSLFVGVIAGIIVSRRLGKQITNLVTATQAITPENLQHRVEVNGVQEIQELALSFNRMVGELDTSQQTRRNLLADVSHELLTPLTVLEGNLRAILDGVYELNEEEISQLYDQTHHLIGLVKELRQLTLAEAHQLKLNLQPTALDAIVEETVTIFEPLAAEKGVSLQQVAAANLPDLNIDRQRIRQVLSNLLSNALRHTPADGSITIQTNLAGSMAQLIVTDTGEGLGEKEASQIFERFYRSSGSARRDAGGAGLGLAIVKALVEAHGGWVSAENNKKAPSSEGAVFTISLPTQGI